MVPTTHSLASTGQTPVPSWHILCSSLPNVPCPGYCLLMYFRKPTTQRKRERRVERTRPEGSRDHRGPGRGVLKSLLLISGVTESRVSVKQEGAEAGRWGAGVAPGKGKRAHQVVKQNDKTQQKAVDRKLRKCYEKTKMEDMETRKVDCLCLQRRRSRGPDGQQRRPQARTRPTPLGPQLAAPHLQALRAMVLSLLRPGSISVCLFFQFFNFCS